MELLIGKIPFNCFKILKLENLRPFTSRHAKNNVSLCIKMKTIIWVQIANNRTYSVFIEKSERNSLAHTLLVTHKQILFCCMLTYSFINLSFHSNKKKRSKYEHGALRTRENNKNNPSSPFFVFYSKVWLKVKDDFIAFW